MERHLVPGVRFIWVVDVFPPKSVRIVEHASEADGFGDVADEREFKAVLHSSESGCPSNIYDFEKCSTVIGPELPFTVTDSRSDEQLKPKSTVLK